MPNQDKRFRRKAKIRAKLTGTSERPRLTVYKSLGNNYAQIIDDSTGKVIVAANDLKSKKGTKTESAKQVGLEIAKAAKAAKVENVVFDRNGFLYHGRIKAIADGAREGGLQF